MTKVRVVVTFEVTAEDELTAVRGVEKSLREKTCLPYVDVRVVKKVKAGF